MKINSKETKNYKVCVIGSGRAAHFFAHRLKDTSASFELIGIVSRDIDKVSKSLFPFSIYDYTTIPKADIYILAVPDDLIRNIAQQIPYSEALFLHCSGAQGKRQRSCATSSYHISRRKPTYSPHGLSFIISDK